MSVDRIYSKLLMVMLVIPLVLSACSTDNPGINGQESISISDTSGHTVQLNQLPQKIVVAGKATPYVLDTIFVFPQASERMAALELRNAEIQKFINLVAPEIEVKPMLENGAGPEQIAPYQPDLAILKNWSISSLGNALQEIGIPAIGLDLETPEAFYEDIQVLGKVFGDQERADAITAYFQQRVESVSQLVGAVDPADKPGVLVIQVSKNGSETAFKVPPQGYLQSKLVEMAGGQPVWFDDVQGSDNWILVGLEQIAAWNPDMIFVINYDADSTETAQQLKASPTWQGLKASESGQIYGFPADYASWDLIDPRWILGLQWMATKTHPELTTSLDIIAEVDQFYSTIYNLDEEQIKTEILPRLNELNP